MGIIALVGAYLGAIVFANLTVAYYGAPAAIWNAFIFISLDITSRDRLHEAWEHTNLVRNMAFLIVAGSALSFAMEYAAAALFPPPPDILARVGYVALASCAAFLGSATADTVTYTALHLYGWYAKVNGSNVASAIVDSALFLGLCALFGVFPPFVALALFGGQVTAKIVGGALWAWVLRAARD